MTLVVALLVAGQIGQLAYFTTVSSWGLEFWYWYLAPPTVFVAATVVGPVAAALLDMSERRVAVAATGLAVSTTLAFAGIVILNAANPASREQDPRIASADAAVWVSQNLPPDARLAMGDLAGAFGYFADRPVVQTEGIINTPEYLDHLRARTIMPHLLAQGVDYFVKMGTSTSRYLDNGCIAFVEPVYGTGPMAEVQVCNTDLVYTGRGPEGWGDVHVWRLRPISDQQR